MDSEDQINPSWRERIRVTDVRILDPTEGEARNDECEVHVELTLAGSARSLGQATGANDPEGRMRAGANATLDALIPVLRGRLDLELQGIRSLREFDAFLVIAAVNGSGGGESYFLVGAVAVPEAEAVRGAVLAVLDSANRVVEHFVGIPG
ncbi:MAG: hypothetical protein EA351_04600 [Gemmatimonadales bacterium]|nr:MAG: hypothetical protein EA351_04600 [Gemmatimonadales bacterium]